MHGVIPFEYDDETHSCLQEALLERTERFIHTLKDVFDGARTSFDNVDATASFSDRQRALNIMVSVVVYTTNVILAASPSVHYAIMFERIQDIFSRVPVIRSEFGDATAANTETVLKPVWATLRAMDSAFATEQ